MYNVTDIIERILNEFGYEEVQNFYLKQEYFSINVSYRYGFAHMVVRRGEAELKCDFTSDNIKVIKDFLSGEIKSDRMFELLRETGDIKMSCGLFWELYKTLVQWFVRFDDTQIIWFGNIGDTIIFEGKMVKFEDSRGFLCIDNPEAEISITNEGNITHACIDFISAMDKLDEFVRALEVSRINILT